MDWEQGGRLAFSFDPVCDLRRQQQKSPHPINPSITVCQSTVKPSGQVVIKKKKTKLPAKARHQLRKQLRRVLCPVISQKKKKISILGVSRSQKIQDGIVRCAWKFWQTSNWWHLQNGSYCELSILHGVGFYKVSNLPPNHPTLYEKGSSVPETQRTGQRLS